MRRIDGMTLIELLVVVAIVSILATIAVVNLQQATIRSQNARVLADMRTIRTGLEAYRVDNRAYPPAALGDLTLECPLARLTSPVAFLTAIPQDPFSPAPLDFNPVGPRLRGYLYRDAASTSQGMPGETYRDVWIDLPDKAYYLHSAGPNRVWDVTPYAEYDPTNGALSRGDVTRFGPG